MDPSQKETASEEMGEIRRCCADCKTTKTPLWRGGPAGPKSLCNACGIRYRKRRSAMLALNKGLEKRKEKPTASPPAAAAAAGNKAGGGNLGEDLRERLVALGNEMVKLQRQRSPMKRQRKLGEEEQAAFLLMSLSCGSVFA
ncbi:GATA transcription factor 16-like [Diospyros lotus]|uniref:GATA transcription factor 16-like n=1 Tax=Diospyros lotus TaxID=55363 RepID=UPI002258FD97|nr:GATA transcription factor 16-like [Diospyros lotus]